MAGRRVIGQEGRKAVRLVGREGGREVQEKAEIGREAGVSQEEGHFQGVH